MLQPSIVTGALVAVFQSLPQLLVQMDGKPGNIFAHNFDYGNEAALAQVIAQLPTPSIVVAYKRILGGNFDQATMWKHQLEIWVAAMSMARPDNPAPMGTPDVAALMMNEPIPSDPGNRNIRQVSLLGGKLI